MKGWCGKKKFCNNNNLSILSVSTVLHHVVAESDAQVVDQLENWLDKPHNGVMVVVVVADVVFVWSVWMFFLTVVQTSLAVTTLDNKRMQELKRA